MVPIVRDTCRGEPLKKPVMRPTQGISMTRKILSVALLTSVAAFTSPAYAADLGEDCCADIEERIAELEATTARKGNRKVSLTVSGWVAEQVTYWDDGQESNAYVGGIGSTLASHFKLTGQATIAPGWTAGYVVQIEQNSTNSLALDQNNDDAGAGIVLLQSYWFLASEKLGKVSVGQLSQASDNAAILVDSSGSLVPANWVIPFDTGAFRFRNPDGTLNALGWSDVTTCGSLSASVGGDCNGVPLNAVRYDTPTFLGFSASASWGEDDFWDVAARYAGEFNGIKIAAAVAYHQTTDERPLGVLSATKRDSSYVQAGLYLQHVPTGLFAYGAYGNEDNNTIYLNGLAAKDSEVWYVKAGLRRKLRPIGHTVVYGEYGNYDDQLGPAALAANVTGSEVEHWGLGIVQEIDAAAMSLWLSYRSFEADLDTAAGAATVNTDDFQLVKFGALINF